MTMKNFENPKFILKCGQIPKDYLLHFFPPGKEYKALEQNINESYSIFLQIT